MKIVLVSALLTVQSINLLIAQEVPRREYDPMQLADELFPLQEEDVNYEDVYEALLQRLSSPLDINQATAEELRALYALNEVQIQELLAYRKQGPLLSLYELQVLPHFEPATIQRVLPLVTISSDLSKGGLIRRILSEENNYLLIRQERTLERSSGFTSNDSLTKYRGSPDRSYLRFRSSHSNDFSLGITAKKDAGESFAWNRSQRGFDFYSYHFRIQNKGILRNLVAGDFQGNFGQGLIFGGGMGIGKGSETITTLKRNHLGFTPYTSLVESGFFRGLAIQLSPSRGFNIHLFGSSVRKDARLLADTTTTGSLTALLTNGLHRSIREAETRKQVTEHNGGLALEWERGFFTSGILVHHFQLTAPIQKDTNLYNQFVFRGEQLTNVSLYFQATMANFVAFGEAAHSLGYGSGAVAGILGSVSRDVDVAIVGRMYQPNFHTFYGNALSENSSPANEQGLYWGIKYQPTKLTILSAYADLFVFPWLKFRTYAPSSGQEWLIRYQGRYNKTTTWSIQLRGEEKPINITEESTTYQIRDALRLHGMVSLDYSFAPVTFRTRIQASQYHLQTTSRGSAIVQDASCRFGKWRLTVRHALFGTDDYNNRQYVSERDVWMAYSMANLYGRGVRSFLMVQYSLTKKIDVWGKWSKTQYTDIESIGSGSQLIRGNSKNDVKFQLRIRL